MNRLIYSLSIRNLTYFRNGEKSFVNKTVRKSFIPFSTSSTSSSSLSSFPPTDDNSTAVEESRGEDKPVKQKRKWLMKKTRQNKPLIQAQRKRNAELEDKAKSMNLEWRIMGSTVLHRYPIILREIEPWEKEMFDLRDKIDDIKRKMLVTIIITSNGYSIVQSFVEQVTGTPADIMNDANPTYEEILGTMPFQPAPRITEADKTKNVHSMDRKLDRSLYLIVKRNRDQYSWQFPQGRILPQETLRAVRFVSFYVACERIVDRAVGKVDRWFLSNGPLAYYCYEYSPEVQNQRKQFGAKVFFMRTQFLKGNLKLETRLYTDYAWISRDEVKDYFHPDMVDFIHAVLVE